MPFGPQPLPETRSLPPSLDTVRNSEQRLWGVGVDAAGEGPQTRQHRSPVSTDGSRAVKPVAVGVPGQVSLGLAVGFVRIPRGSIPEMLPNVF